MKTVCKQITTVLIRTREGICRLANPSSCSVYRQTDYLWPQCE